MHTKSLTKKLGGFALAGALALGAAACEDDPTGPDDHADPASVRLILNGAEIARAPGSGAGNATGQIQLQPGEETAHITVEFLDEDGDPVELDDDLYLEVDVADLSVAEFEQDTPGEFGGHAHGLAVGATTMTFKLMHGAVGAGHPDFVAAAIPVVVG